MPNISSGIQSIDSLIDFLHVGDNVVWEVDSGTSYELFTQNFIRHSFADSQKVIYISFNKSPQSAISAMGSLLNPEHFILIDCFTSGKGKNDNAFLRFYEKPHKTNIIRIDNPKSIEQFTHVLNSIEDGLPPGARYVFDSLTGMQDLWGDENSTYKFFTYMCPRLYDLKTVAYWILEKDAHSQKFKANLRHITQVVFELYKRREELYIKAHKLEGRNNRAAFKPHLYEIEDNKIFVVPAKKELSLLDIGDKIKDARIKLGMSQKDLADKIDMTSSFISQIESNQISPSLNSFLQITDALNIDPSGLFRKDGKPKEISWLIGQDLIKQNLIEKTREYSMYNIVSNGHALAYVTVINSGEHLDRHFSRHKKNELIYVAKGKISVKIDNEEREIKAGDSIYLKDSVPSEWTNISGEKAELIVFCN
ncbi:MAG: helix-turn-helix domain-containing protein [Nitrospirota bacterium]